jgi:hypothetical protein
MWAVAKATHLGDLAVEVNYGRKLFIIMAPGRKIFTMYLA